MTFTRFNFFIKTCSVLLMGVAYTNSCLAEPFQFNGKEVEVLICNPENKTISPGVIYHHGSRYARGVGGAPAETCDELAKLGYVGIVPMRPDFRSRDEIIRFVQATVDYAKSISKVDASRIAAIGYSQGGVFTYLTATASSDLKAAVILAAGAGPRGGSDGAAQVQAPILIMVAENDIGSATSLGRNFKAETKQLYDGLKAANKDVQYVVLPATEGDGHKVFWTVGPYWEFVKSFLQDRLR